MRILLNVLTIFSCLLFYQVCNAQSAIKYIEIDWKNGSEAAKKIMVSDFYYNLIDAWSPFGSDRGNDTYYLYCDWKSKHPNENVKGFIDEELIACGYPGFDLYLDGSDPKKLKSIVNTMQNQYISLNNINIIVISLAFSQLFLEGRIEPEVKRWAEAAFSREKVFLNFWGEDGEKERVEREERMDQLLSDLRKG
ncbi:hypothetical protein [Sphingobacterium sp. DR205]|uniref:hypothetical protein n=1 Tax=Sphingobacterium sp. DR205 TaxID=2713573 RepID=UPI0013E4356F|nr:hypothetical protein [Sphingobacterium sp. DR205]QIH34482.1 hypothetical protein G6053_16995 [Sphingobacterium sp. DR205]